MLARHRFVIKDCRNLSDCISRKEANVTNCWRLNQRVVSGQLLFGTLGAILNMVVFFNILFTRSLRKNVSMVFLSNLALGDTLTCVFLVLIASIIVSYRYQDFENVLESLCPRVGFLWVLGQCTTSITSVALTVERYLCIVFSMNPGIRVTSRLAFMVVAVNWVFAALFMSVAFLLQHIPAQLPLYTNDLRHEVSHCNALQYCFGLCLTYSLPGYHSLVCSHLQDCQTIQSANGSEARVY